MSAEYNYLRDIVAVPLVIWKDKNLNPTEKMILVDIIGLIKHNHCFKGNQGFSDLVGVSKDRITRILSDLKKRGYININIEKNSNNNNRKRTISLTAKFRNTILNGLAFEETKIVEKKEVESVGIGENNYTGVSVFSPRGIGENTDRGIGVNTEIRSHIEEVKEDFLNINEEASSSRVENVDLFGEVKPVVKKTKAVEKEPAHKAHHPIQVFWFKEFSIGSRFEIQDGAFIKKIIKNIEVYLNKNKHPSSPDDVVNFFKIMCTEKLKLKNQFLSTSGLNNMASSNTFKQIVDSIKLQNNGQQLTNNRQSRAGVTSFKFNVPDPRMQSK